MDELMCKNFESEFCGHKPFWSFIIGLALMPLCMYKELRDLSYFTGFANIVSAFAIIVLLVYEGTLLPGQDYSDIVWFNWK